MISGIVCDHRADLYAVGVMLYHMLTGEMPRGRFRPASEKAGTDVRFDAIVEKAMETGRERRYQGAREIRRDLDVILTTPMEKPSLPQQQAASARKPVMQRPQPRSDNTPVVAPGGKAPDGRSAVVPNRRSARVLIGVLAAAPVGLGAFFMFQKPKASPVPRSSGLQPPAKNLRDSGYNAASSFEQGPTHPAVNVNWEDATTFCEWLTERE